MGYLYEMTWFFMEIKTVTVVKELNRSMMMMKDVISARVINHYHWPCEMTWHIGGGDDNEKFVRTRALWEVVKI